MFDSNYNVLIQIYFVFFLNFNRIKVKIKKIFSKIVNITKRRIKCKYETNKKKRGRK